MGRLANLEYLGLTNNDLSGPIPAELGPPCQSGAPVAWWQCVERAHPPELGSLANLEYLSLAGNTLAGPIPAELGGLSNLEYLWLGGNALSGPIPPELGRLANLRTLSLGRNELSGPIVDEQIRGRDAGCPAPPAQIRTCALTHPAPALEC